MSKCAKGVHRFGWFEMSDLNANKWHNPIAREIPVWHDVGQVTAELCGKALNDVKSRLHPLLRDVDLDRLDQRDDFLHAFKSALEKRIAQKLAALQPNIQAIFQFDQRRIIDIQTWDGSVHLLAKVPLLSTSIGTLGKKLDHGLVRYLTRLNWQRFQGSRSILDVQQVTLNELRHSIGYAAMFCAVYTALVRVWPQDKRAR